MPGKRHICWLLLIAAILLGTAGPVAAEQPTAREKKQAKKLVDAASDAKEKGDKLSAKGKDAQARKSWRKAVLAYLEAYSLTDHPFLLFKLAEIYRARGEKLWALAGFYTYLDRDPGGPGEERAKVAVEELEQELDRKAGDAETSGAPELDPSAVFDSLPRIEEPEPEPEPAPEPVPEPEPEPEPAPTRDDGPRQDGHPGRLLRWSGYGSAALGGVLLGLGIKFGVDASAASSALSSNDGAWTAEDRQRIDAGEQAEERQILFTLLGTAAVGTGVALWWVGHRAEQRDRKRKRAEAALAPAPGGALLVVGGRF